MISPIVEPDLTVIFEHLPAGVQLVLKRSYIQDIIMDDVSDYLLLLSPS